jgi:cellobiose-specific phosphotransferase system component IIC
MRFLFMEDTKLQIIQQSQTFRTIIYTLFIYTFIYTGMDFGIVILHFLISKCEQCRTVSRHKYRR